MKEEKVRNIGNQLKLTKIELKKIVFDTRKKELFEEKPERYITELAENIRRIGLHEPISVRYDKEKGEYHCLSGENRIHAVTLLGWTEIDGYIVNPKDELGFMISRKILRTQIGHKQRVKIYKAYCPDLLTPEIKKNRIEEVSFLTGISKATVYSDLKKLKTGVKKEESIEELSELWSKKKIKGLVLSLTGLTDGSFLLIVSGKNLKYEWRGKLKEVLKECASAARSPWFDKTYKPENSETATRIKQLRTDAGLTQFQLSQAIGYSQSYLAELEAGKWTCPKKLFETIAIYCQEKIA